MYNRIITVCVLTVCFGMIGYYLIQHSPPSQNIATPEPALQEAGYFVFGDPNSDSTLDFPPYRDTDKIIVSKLVLDMFPSGVGGGVLNIGGAKTARESFVTQNGASLDPNDHWRVFLNKAGTVNGQTRIAVAAFHGHDPVAQEFPVPLDVYELWSVNNDGSNPQLIERSFYPFEGPDHLSTHAEVPASTPLVGGMPEASGLGPID